MRTERVEIDAASPTPGVDARTPGVVRRELDGTRTRWRPREDFPTEAERQAARRTFARHDAGPVLCTATCAACMEGGMQTAVVSGCVSVRDTGLCDYCLLCAEGRLDGTIARRQPTLEEALAHVDDARPAEVRVLLAELKRMIGDKKEMKMTADESMIWRCAYEDCRAEQPAVPGDEEEGPEHMGYCGDGGKPDPRKGKWYDRVVRSHKWERVRK